MFRAGALLMLVFCSLSRGQDLKFINTGLEEGLSQSVVLDILQDNRGFLWIATQDGLNRYDGRTFKIYKQNPLDSASLSDNWINSICIQNGFLWIATEYGGICRMDLVLEKFTRVRIDSAATIRCIAPDKSGNIWIGTWGQGVYCLNTKNLQYKNFNKESGLSHNKIRSIAVDRNNKVWIGTYAGIDCLDQRTESMSHYYPNETDKSSRDNFIVAVYQDDRGKVWIGTPAGIFSITGKKISKLQNDESFPLSDNYITCINQDKSGAYWFGTLNGGLNKLERYKENESAKFITYKHVPANYNSISCNYIRKIFQDNALNVWIGSWGGGLSRFDAKPGKFVHIRPVPDSENTLSFPFIRGFYKFTSGDLLIGTDGNGIDYYNSLTGTYSNFSFTEEGFLDNNYVYCFTRDSEGNIWIGTFGGLMKWPDSGSKADLRKSIIELGTVFKFSYIRSIVEYRKGLLLIGAREGLVFFDTHQKKAVLLNKAGFPGESVTSILRESAVSFWAGTINGLYYITFSGDKPLKAEKYDSKGKGQLSSNKINALLIDRGKKLWIGTSLGLNLYDRKSGSFRYVLSGDGLPNDIINGLLEDASGDLWVSTNKGISRITADGKTLSFRNYDISDGLQSNEFNQAACYMSEDGEIFFGGINGFNRFYPSAVNDNKFIPPVTFTGIKIFNKEIHKERADMNHRELRLSYDENYLSFDFASLDFTNPERNQYKYKMEGFDKEWIFAGNHNYASYTNLDPGEYVFRVIASNNDGIWNNRGDYFRIIVEPPYWMTWWFRIVTAALVLSIIMIVYRSRIRRMLEIERLRVRIASDLHDEVGASLTKISMQAGLAVYEKDPVKIKPKLEKIENISREVIGMMSDTIWSIDARNDTVEDLITRMKDFAFNLLNELPIEFKFSAEGLQSGKKLPVDIRQNIYLIYKEAINNSVKYSGASLIDVRLVNCDGVFSMRIEDNGSGISSEKKLKGNGLRNMKMRADRIQGKLELVSERGASVIFTMKEL